MILLSPPPTDFISPSSKSGIDDTRGLLLQSISSPSLIIIDKIPNRNNHFLFKPHVVYSCKFVPQVQIKFHYVCSLSLQNWKVNFFPFSTIPQNIIVPFFWENGNIARCFKFPSKYEFVRCKLFWSNLNQSSPCRKDCLKHSEHAHHKYQEEEFQKRNIKILLHTSMLSKPVISMLEWHTCYVFWGRNLNSFFNLKEAKECINCI